MRNGYRVIDTDTHVTPSMEVLHKYAGKAIKDRWDEFKPYMRTMKSPPGRGHSPEPWTTLKIKPIPYNRVAGEKGEVEKIEKGGAGALEGRVANIAKKMPSDGTQHDNPGNRLIDMDKEGVDVNIIFPGTWAPAVTAIDPSLAIGLYDAYHNYMSEFCSADYSRLKGLMMAPGADPEWAAAEIRKRGKEPWVSCVWPSLPEGIPVDDPDNNQIWEAMNEMHLPIVHHSFFYEPPYFPGYRDIWGNAAIARTAAHPWGAQRLLAYVIASGMLDRYPNINVGFSETGHGWLPYWLKRLDSQLDYVGGSLAGGLKMKPSEYAQGGRVFCSIESHEGAEMTKAVNDVLGDGCLMYASDFPHPECDWPRSVDNVIAWGNVLGDGALKKLLATNAENYFRLS
jgi:predicted TIM-barrel fold metal-dependent hydrolase